MVDETRPEDDDFRARDEKEAQTEGFDVEAQEQELRATDHNRELFDYIPEHLKAGLTEEELQELSKVKSLEDLIKHLEDIRERIIDDLGIEDQLNPLVNKFYEGQEKEKKNLVMQMFSKMFKSMVNVSPAQEAKAIDSPITEEVAKQKAAEWGKE